MNRRPNRGALHLRGGFGCWLIDDEIADALLRKRAERLPHSGGQCVFPQKARTQSRRRK